MFATVTPKQVRDLLNAPAELALLDVREHGAYSAGHIFSAVAAPLSHLERQLFALVPRKDVPLVLVDDGNGSTLAQTAAARMAGWGYSDIRILENGLAGWRAAGNEVFSGIWVPSKAFGEYVEHACDTPAIDAAEFKRWIDEKKNMIVLDSRPYTEFNLYSMPNGICCPGAELTHRAFSLVTDETTTIVVNCAGRTRGIIGAQSLINAGIKNPVVTVRNGTAGWYLSGQKLAEGRTVVAPPPTEEGLRRAQDASRRVAEKFGVQEVGVETLSAWQKDPKRTLYVLDVRTPEEYAVGHLAGSRCAPGGQLVQQTDQYVGVRNARLVLVDDNGVRARMTASWLVQMGWTDVAVLRDGLLASGRAALERGEERMPMPALPAADARAVTVMELVAMRDAGSCLVIDLDTSLRFSKGHIAGAHFAVRSRFGTSLPPLPRGKTLVLTSDDGSFARLAAADARAAYGGEVCVLAGGTAAWKAAGLPVVAGKDGALDAFDDIWYNPYEIEDRTKAMNDYLTWEVDLLDQIQREESVRFSCDSGAQAPARRQA